MAGRLHSFTLEGAQRRDACCAKGEGGHAAAHPGAAGPCSATTWPGGSGRNGGAVHLGRRRAGLAPVGGHRLRHALATEMLRRGGNLIEIAQVLRQSDLGTTSDYAKVDRTALRTVAQPWPGASR